jgi:dTDP-4-dehydrorhamnose reductase
MIKKTFIEAYIQLYGTSKKEAEKAYKNATPDYIIEIINSYKNDAKKQFYND